jgi:hypothetical protein
MVVRRFSVVVAALAAMTSAVAVAQNSAAPASTPAQLSAAVPDGGMPEFVHPETPEQRQARLGTAEDPGPNPDPTKHFWRFGKSYHITKFERRLAAYDASDKNYVRPMAMVNFAYEVYQQNEKYVWCWMPELDTDTVEEATKSMKTPTSARYKEEDVAFFAKIRPQFEALTPPDAGKTIRFAESSEGLPQSGSYRNSLAVADMNGDGCPDLIAPPPRKGGASPEIFLGDCKGHWKFWQEATWPHGVDYGGVAAADFNKDGHMDLVFAVHLNGIYVFLGDGKGHFTESAEGLPRDYPSRRVVTADIDGDGWTDIVAISEGPDALETHNGEYGGIRAYLNRKKATSWEGVNVVDPNVRIGGDWLSIGHFNSDKYADVIGSSVYYNGTTIANLSDGPKKWKFLLSDGDVIPIWSYYFASTVGKFDKQKKDEAIVSYVRFWPTDLDSRLVSKPPIVEMTSVDRFVFVPDGLGVKRIPIMRWSGHVGVHGLASADFDGDGNLDLIITSEEFGQRKAIVLLGDGNGDFRRADVDGLTLEENNIYDIKVADVNGDKRPDVIVMYENFEQRRDDFMRMITAAKPGSIKVFLNRGGAKNVQPAMKAAK